MTRHGPVKLVGDLPESTEKFFEPHLRVPMIRSSALKTLEHCPRKFLYQYRMGLQPRGYSAALERGSMFHQLMQWILLGESEDVAFGKIDEYAEELHTKLVATANPAGFLPDGKDVTGLRDEIEQDRDKAKAMVSCYLDLAPFDWDKYEILKAPDGTPLVEVLLETEHEGLPTLRSPCDLARLRKGTNEVWIDDYKTTSADVSARAASVQMSPQLALYREVLQDNLDRWGTGLKVVGSIHHIVATPSIKYCPTTKDKAGFHVYIERVKEWYSSREDSIQRTHNRFSGEVSRLQLLSRMERFGKYATRKPNLVTYWQAGDYACHEFNRVCPYMPLCTHDPIHWPELAETLYQVSFREDTEEDVLRGNED